MEDSALAVDPKREEEDASSAGSDVEAPAEQRPGPPGAVRVMDREVALARVWQVLRVVEEVMDPIVRRAMQTKYPG